MYGGGFGVSLGNGEKLTNFAAPIGHTQLRNASGVIKPIGSTLRDRDEYYDDETENSGIEGEGVAGGEDNENDEVDTRFQHQDGEPLSFDLWTRLTHLS